MNFITFHFITCVIIENASKLKKKNLASQLFDNATHNEWYAINATKIIQYRDLTQNQT